MTAEEKKHYNNGFILGMASKGVIQKNYHRGCYDGFQLTLYNNITNAREFY